MPLSEPTPAQAKRLWRNVETWNVSTIPVGTTKKPTKKPIKKPIKKPTKPNKKPTGAIKKPTKPFERPSMRLVDVSRYPSPKPEPLAVRRQKFDALMNQIKSWAASKPSQARERALLEHRLLLLDTFDLWDDRRSYYY